MLPFGIERRYEDPAYLAAYDGSTCVASDDKKNLCGKPSVGAHISVNENGKTRGAGMKTHDYWTLPLCHEHHLRQEDNPGSDWWVDHVLKPMAYQRFLTQKRKAL